MTPTAATERHALGVLERLAEIASSHEDRASRARRVAEEVRAARGYRWVGVYDVLPDEISAIAWTGADPPAHPRFPRGLGLGGAAVASGDAVVAADVSRDPRSLATFPTTGSEAVVPVRSGPAGAVVGTIDAESDRTGAFAAEDLAFLRACARAVLPLWAGRARPEPGVTGDATGTSGSVTCRPARPDDAGEIARIYNQGIAERSATFETRPRDAADVAAWLENPVVVAEEAGAVVGWAALSPTSARSCYAGVLELSIYVDRGARARGVGRALGGTILAAAADRGAWKIVGKLFADNLASASLVRALGFREVGVHRRHARLDGAWRDVLVVEKLVGEAAEG